MKDINNNFLSKKNVILRVDLNVPVHNGVIKEKSRIKAIKSTIKKLINQKNKIFILSHFGRPLGKRDKKFSLKFICSTLKKEFEINKIYFLDNLNNNKINNTINKMKFGEICLFENIRFYPEEEKNDVNFIKKLSKNFDAYVNDAFSASHRQHSSIVGFPKVLPSFAGNSLLKEIESINSFIKNPKKPNIAIIGGSKISTKINLIKNLTNVFDFIVIGGAMANTFLKIEKIDIGKSLYEKDFLKVAHNILKKAKNVNCKIILPVDVICSNTLSNKSNIIKCNVKNVLSDQMILDVGPKTTEIISKHILKSNMILWNGPLGAIEYTPFRKSSVKVANIIKKHTKTKNISSLAGGGDTILAIKQAKAENGFTYISKAGGAFLEWLEGKKIPGVIALNKNNIS
tara:strand:+ start:487 stop:1686 length:1200 start_codon:yes stop_codon:yes gene_type:complete